MGMNRRKAMGLLAAGVAITEAAAQAPTSSGQTTPAPASLPLTADQELEAARQSRKDDARRIAAFPLPPTTEPAFQFHA